MPLYVYRCEHCGHEFEQMAKMDAPNPECPKILMRTSSTQPDGAPPVEHDVPCGWPTKKLITGGTFHLKGSGWASDGYS